VQPEDDHYQAPKPVVVSYVQTTLYSTNKYSYVRPVQTLYIGYFKEHIGEDEPHDSINTIIIHNNTPESKTNKPQLGYS
jgi:hypothetical protein